MGRNEDTKRLLALSREQIPEFIYLQLRNLWTVDGLYFLGIEEAFGTDAATKIDARGNDIPSMMNALRCTTWALDLEDKEIIVEKNRAIVRNVRCRVQNTRRDKGLPEFGCKPVRFGFLKAFAKEFNPAIVVKCTVCPPDTHPENIWCEWEFTCKER